MRNKGKLIIYLILIITFCLWILSKDFNSFTDSIPKLAGQITGLFAIVLFSIEFILATRIKFIEEIFGGLDKLYKTHHIIGGIAFILMLNHPVLLALDYLGQASMIFKLLLPSNTISYSVGVLSLYSLIVILFINYFLKIPYHFWKFVHILIGIPLFFAGIHVLLISSDISNNLILNIWILSFIMLASLSFIYKRFLYTFFGPVFEYEIVKINSANTITEIWLKAKSQKLKFSSGQFVFLRATTINFEKHPYTISSAPQEDLIRISIKSLGDYTSKINQLRIGDSIELYGPYGNFGEKYISSNKDLIWIGAGIGITPFLSFARNEFHSQLKNRKIDLFYCTSNVNESIYDNEAKFITNKCTNINYHQYNSDKFGRIDVNKIQNLIPDLGNRIIMLCGPVTMMESLADQFMKKGISPLNIIYEDFNFVE